EQPGGTDVDRVAQRAADPGSEEDDQVKHWVESHLRPNNFSISAWPSFTHVGRPWLHWPERGVTSISRSSAFISATESTRPALTEPWQAMVAATWSSLSRRLSGPPSSTISLARSLNNAETSVFPSA